jgi:NADH-quinone oxidoreductase subunit J
MELAVFALFALLALASSIVVVAHRNPIYSTMSLVVTLFSVAVLFVLLGAPFIAALQILIYAGAILVLFLFVIMLLNVQREEASHSGQAGQRWAAMLGAALLCGMLAMLFWRTRAAVFQGPLTEQLVSLKALAGELFADYLLPFEIIGLLLLVAVIGATVVARRPPGAAQEASASDLSYQKAGDAGWQKAGDAVDLEAEA